MDTFDHKPVLNDLNGKKFDPGDGRLVESVTNSPGIKVPKSPFAFRQHGECGRWVSDVLPHMASVVDALAFLMSMMLTDVFLLLFGALNACAVAMTDAASATRPSRPRGSILAEV